MPRPARPDMASSLRTSLVLLVSLTALLTAVQLCLIWAVHVPYEWYNALLTAEGFASVCIGAAAWDRRPTNRTGALLCVLGGLSLASGFGAAPETTLQLGGTVLAVAPISALLHVLLAFPSGRLRNRGDVVVVVLGYVVLTGSEAALYIAEVGAAQFPGWHLHTSAAVTHDAHLVQSRAAWILLGGGCLLRLWRMWLERRQSGHSTHLFVYSYGIIATIFFPFSAQILKPALGLSVPTLFLVQTAVFAGVPFVFAAGVLRDGFARSGHIEQLGDLLATGGSSMRDALAATLGDASVVLTYPAAAQGDRATRPGRGTVEISGSSGPLATVEYDRTLIADPGFVRAAGQLVGLAIERETLSAELIDSRQAVRESRTRILQVSDEERRRLARDLHDGVQGRLVLAALNAGRMATQPGTDERARDELTALRDEINGVIDELRGQVRGLMPPLLIDRGLLTALEDLAERSPLPVSLTLVDDGSPIPELVASSAYFITAEAVTNALKHSRATSLTMLLRRDATALHLTVSDDGIGGVDVAPGHDPVGMGLRSMIDRVEALDGLIRVHSPAAAGTRIEVTLPCGW